MKPASTELVVVGKIGTTYGIQGWLKIISFTNPITNIVDYAPWFLENGEQWDLVKVTDIREHGKGIVAKLQGQNTPEQARLLTGKKIAVERTQLPTLDKNEFYWSDLQGLTVIDQHGTTLGTVSYLISTGSNDVLIIKGEKEHAIPYLPGDVVKSVDLEAHVIHVDWELV